MASASLGLLSTLAAAEAVLGPEIRVEGVIGGLERGARGWFSRLVGEAPSALLGRPFGLAWSGERLLVTDPEASRVLAVTTASRLVVSTSVPLASPIGVARCEFGIVVADSRSGEVALFNDRLRLQRSLATGLVRPSGVACDQERVFVAETGAHRLLVIPVEGGEAETWGSRGVDLGQFNYPSALALGPDGLWVGDTLNGRLQLLRIEDGKPLRELGHLGDAPGETPRVKGITVDSAGRVWVSDALLDQLAVFGREGALLATIGGHGDRVGEFSFPAGLAAHPDGSVAVADSLNRRVQILRLIPDEATTPPGGWR